MEGEGPQITFRSNPFWGDTRFSRPNRHAFKCSAGQHARNLLRPLFGLQGASAVDKKTARLDELRCGFKQPLLQLDQALQVTFSFQAQQIGMTPNGASGQTRRIEKNGIEQLTRRPFRHVCFDNLNLEPKPSQIILQPLDPFGVNLDRGHLRTGRSQLCRLAARRGAEISDALAGHVAQ